MLLVEELVDDFERVAVFFFALGEFERLPDCFFVFISFCHLTPFGRPARAGCLAWAGRAGGGILPSIYT